MCSILSFLRLLKKLFCFIKFLVCSWKNWVVGLFSKLAWWSLYFFWLFKTNRFFGKRQGLNTYITSMALFTYTCSTVEVIFRIIFFLIRLVLLGIVIIINGFDIFGLLFCFYFLFGSVRNLLLSCLQVSLCLSSLEPSELNFGVGSFLVCLFNLNSRLSFLLLFFGFHFK